MRIGGGKIRDEKLVNLIDKHLNDGRAIRQVPIARDSVGFF